MFSMSSRVSRLTRPCQDTHPRHSPCSDCSFLAFSWACCATLPSHIPRIPSCHQYNGMCYLHLFAGKTHQVRSCPASGWAILTCIPSSVAFTLPETKTYWTRSHRQLATSGASCDGHRRRLFIQSDGPYFTDTCSRQTHDRTPSTRASCGVPLPFPVAGADTNLSTLSSRDLQRWWEARARLSGKLGPKASSLIEMYREKEGQAATRSSLGKSSGSTSQ
jgi:hypothetical protein